jgi:hypothetical protein
LNIIRQKRIIFTKGGLAQLVRARA